MGSGILLALAFVLDFVRKLIFADSTHLGSPDLHRLTWHMSLRSRHPDAKPLSLAESCSSSPLRHDLVRHPNLGAKIAHLLIDIWKMIEVSQHLNELL